MQKDKLSCWSWYVGAPQDRLDFGAHDFRGGSFTSAMQVGAWQRVMMLNVYGFATRDDSGD
jgi:hypothetical protein